jgi:hypothetical protein
MTRQAMKCLTAVDHIANAVAVLSAGHTAYLIATQSATRLIFRLWRSKAKPPMKRIILTGFALSAFALSGAISANVISANRS